MMRSSTVFLALVFGISAACNTYASFFDVRYANYALVSLLPCAALIWALPTTKREKKKAR